MTEEDCGDALTVACAGGAGGHGDGREHGAGRVVSFSAGDLSVRKRRGRRRRERNALRRQAERLMAPYARDESFAFWEVEG